MKCIVYTILFVFASSYSVAQHSIHGRVISARDGSPLQGALVRIKGMIAGAITGSNGEFSLSVSGTADTIVITLLGYEEKRIAVTKLSNEPIIALHEGRELLSEVTVSTGYYELPRERATGSFTFISNELLNRGVSTDIVSRLEGLTNSLLFDRRRTSDAIQHDNLQLRIRGKNSINTSGAPLIILDNFPYQGNINHINPSDIESITILKDAAAASIWGARAGNGVIVITSKKGRFNQQPEINFSSSIAISDKPDLFYDPRYLKSSSFIEAETEFFRRGLYQHLEEDTDNPPLSPVVEILIKQRDGLMSQAEADARIKDLSQRDVRRDMETYLYRYGAHQQYALNAAGGSRLFRYYVSGGYNRDLSSTIGNRYDRLTLNSLTTFRPADYLHITAGIAYVYSASQNNGIVIGSALSRFPYNKPADENGNPLPVLNDYRYSYIAKAESEGFLDWQYRPLDELSMADITHNGTELRINTGLRYQLIEGLNIDFKYQYQKISGEYRRLDNPESYIVRNLVNRFTQEDGTREFPFGSILNINNNHLSTHSARVQANYHSLIGNRRHLVNILAGAELREEHARSNGFELYGYDDNVLTYQTRFDYLTRFPVNPSGNSRIPTPNVSMNDLLDRYLSYYGNFSYTFDNKYILSASTRWDASNLFGVKTNQKGVPLWSVGASWNISEENFYRLSILPYLKLRVTYGYNGNVNKDVTAFPTAFYSTDFLTGLKKAEIRSPGNPQLRWEKVSTWNLGMDFRTAASRVTGSIEYYQKTGTDLLGEIPVDPTTGINTNLLGKNLINYAKIRTKGIELELRTKNITKGLHWQTDFLFSYSTNKVVHYNQEMLVLSGAFDYSVFPQEGKSADGIYSYPWIGLDPQTGDPLVVINGEPSTDYTTYVRERTLEDLVYNGVSVPPFFGAMRNTFSWRQFSLSANLTFKAGYHFRRTSINYSGFLNDWSAHKDFEKRWQKPGDERVTQVPSMPEEINRNRDHIYLYSQLLIEKGDHIRLQDIRLSYELDGENFRKAPVKRISVFIYARNLGIIWRANDQNLDPDFPSASFPTPRTIAIGLRANFY